MAVIPPEAAEQADHREPCQIFQKGGDDHPDQEQKQQVMRKGTKQGGKEQGRKSVDDTEGPFHETAVDNQVPGFNGQHDAFHHKAKKAEEDEDMDDAIKIHTEDSEVPHSGRILSAGDRRRCILLFQYTEEGTVRQGKSL